MPPDAALPLLMVNPEVLLLRAIALLVSVIVRRRINTIIQPHSTHTLGRTGYSGRMHPEMSGSFSQ
jgi:hypothetical protein